MHLQTIRLLMEKCFLVGTWHQETNLILGEQRKPYSIKNEGKLGLPGQFSSHWKTQSSVAMNSGHSHLPRQLKLGFASGIHVRSIGGPDMRASGISSYFLNSKRSASHVLLQHLHLTVFTSVHRMGSLWRRQARLITSDSFWGLNGEAIIKYCISA